MLTTVEKVLFLMRAPITAEITTEALTRLAEVAVDVTLSRGDPLFANADEAIALFIIVDGAVRVDSPSAPSRLAEAGDVVGALPLLAGAPHSGTARALTTTQALRVERVDLMELLDEDGELARALFAGIVRYLHAMVPPSAEAV
jgi:CRP-like cAMP-binding protein